VRFAYADPPYYGMGAKLYGHPEWDSKKRHKKLIDELRGYDGWALSCNPADLWWLVPWCPDDVRVAAWTKTYHQWRPVSVQYAWEPVIFRGGRTVLRRNPMVRDWYSCPSNHRGGLVGSKPPAFCRWILDLLGFDANADTLDDLFPGSGIMEKVASQGVLA
jgi:hypothetical protein